MFNFFFWKSCCWWDIVEKYSSARQVTNGIITWRMRLECWINEATDLQLEYVTLLSHGQNGEAKASRYYFTRTLPTVFYINLSNRIFLVSVRVIWRDKCAESSFVIDVFQLHEPRPSNQVAVNKLSSHSTFAFIPRIVKAEKKSVVLSHL
jgi:hypothetical protein